MDDIKNEMANFSARKNAKEMDEAEIKKLVDAQEKKSNRFIMSLKIPKKQKPKVQPIKIKPYVAENPYTANEYKANMLAALDDNTRKALAESKNEEFVKE